MVEWGFDKRTGKTFEVKYIVTVKYQDILENGTITMKFGDKKDLDVALKELHKELKKQKVKDEDYKLDIKEL